MLKSMIGHGWTHPIDLVQAFLQLNTDVVILRKYRLRPAAFARGYGPFAKVQNLLGDVGSRFFTAVRCD